INVLSCSINTLKELYDIFGVEVDQNFYCQIGVFSSPWPSTYYLLSCNCYLIRFSYYICSEPTNHSGWVRNE
ncbi:ATP synthase subunit a chloroplastic, partial [Phtheirospermum japonicum]